MEIIEFLKIKYILVFLVISLIVSILMIIFKLLPSLTGLIAGSSICFIIFFLIIALFFGFDFNIRRRNLIGWKEWILTMYYIVGTAFCIIQGSVLRDKIINFIEKLFR